MNDRTPDGRDFLIGHIMSLSSQLSTMSAKLDSFLGRQVDMQNDINAVRGQVAEVRTEVREMKQQTAISKARLVGGITVLTGAWSAIAVFAVPAAKKFLGI